MNGGLPPSLPPSPTEMQMEHDTRDVQSNVTADSARDGRQEAKRLQRVA